MTTEVSDRETSSTFVGIYDVPETARYLKAATHGDVVYGVTSAKLIRWIRRGIASPELVDLHGNELLIDFEDLTIYPRHHSPTVSWRALVRNRSNRAVVESENRNFTSPFATEFLWTGQGEIFVDWTQQLLSASRNGQLALELLKDYLIPIHGLMFSEETHVATSWEPTEGIVLEPQIQFGSP